MCCSGNEDSGEMAPDCPQLMNLDSGGARTNTRTHRLGMKRKKYMLLMFYFLFTFIIEYDGELPVSRTDRDTTKAVCVCIYRAGPQVTAGWL